MPCNDDACYLSFTVIRKRTTGWRKKVFISTQSRPNSSLKTLLGFLRSCASSQSHNFDTHQRLWTSKQQFDALTIDGTLSLVGPLGVAEQHVLGSVCAKSGLADTSEVPPRWRGAGSWLFQSERSGGGGGMLEAILADCVFLPPPSHLYFCASLVSTVLLFVAVSFIVTQTFIFVLITCLYVFFKNSDVDQFVLQFIGSFAHFGCLIFLFFFYILVIFYFFILSIVSVFSFIHLDCLLVWGMIELGKMSNATGSCMFLLFLFFVLIFSSIKCLIQGLVNVRVCVSEWVVVHPLILTWLHFFLQYFKPPPSTNRPYTLRYNLGITEHVKLRIHSMYIFVLQSVPSMRALYTGVCVHLLCLCVKLRPCLCTAVWECEQWPVCVYMLPWQDIVLWFFLLLLLSFFSIINWITECERARSRWCVSAYMLKDCCMNACEKTGIFSFADSLRWGWGKTRGQNAQRGLGGKKIPEITTETLNSYE